MEKTNRVKNTTNKIVDFSFFNSLFLAEAKFYINFFYNLKKRKKRVFVIATKLFYFCNSAFATKKSNLVVILMFSLLPSTKKISSPADSKTEASSVNNSENSWS